MPAKKKATFEQQLADVEALITRMESGELSLEDAMNSYEQGVRTLQELEKQLQSATQRLTEIRKNADGEIEEIPVEDET